ncbi:major facilitator superfamily domain-containing protein [Paraphoma chrysanthemicola]|uniref:Major facilitator superfamily domain-containing protein n=1 Tax=Paraphoma chrysanthemicola TaxID=798071 RepID=A0A8K0VXE6_9PLEO|nr:major facilitator superfamily domain-containing protein [Paraphoma chrysanthemicola]
MPSQPSKQPPSKSPTVNTTSISSSDSDAAFEERLLSTIAGPTYLVDWYAPSDAGNPQNLPRWRKWLITMSVALYVLTTTFSSSVFSAAAGVVAVEFGVTVETMVAAGTSMFMLGFAVGAVMFGPLSERYGRKGPLVVGYLGFAILQLPVAEARSVGTIFVFRLLQGVFGSAPSAVLSGTLADIWTPQQRGFAMPAVGSFLMIGPILGPIIGSVIVHSTLGWRWIEYIVAITSISILVITYPVLVETYSPVLLARRAKRMRSMTQNWAYRAKIEETETSTKNIIEQCLAKPAKMLFLEPILLFMSLYISVVFGLMYVFFLAYPMSFIRERGWPQTRAGLPLLAILIGCILGSLLISFTVKTRLAPNPQKGRARETRMLLMMIGAILLPAGIFAFGYFSSADVSAWPQILAGLPIGIGIILINMQGLNYIIDCYGINSNSAIAANTFMRSLFASGFPVFATSMYTSLGVEKATMILGGLGVVLMPIPVLFLCYGESIRKRSRWVPA